MQINDIRISGGGGGGSGSGVVNVGPAGQAYGGGDPSTTGPATNRLAAMKAAFQSQYKSQVSENTNEGLCYGVVRY